MKGMEIFNTEDYSDDFMEFDDSMNVGDVKPEEIDNKQKSKRKVVKTPVNDQIEVENDKDKDVVEDDDDPNKLEVLLPSGKGQDATDNISSNSSTLSPKFFSSLV